VSVSLVASNLSKSFNRRMIFRGISFALDRGETLLVAGRNGAGKSTLAKIIAGVLTPNAGTIELQGDSHGGLLQRCAVFGFVSPYLQLYDEFTAVENLRYCLAIRGMEAREDAIRGMLQFVGLGGRGDDPLRSYSSGMKQRAKYAFALVHHPPVLILDEPMANLDAEGTALVRAVMTNQRREGILIVATNDVSDLDRVDRKVDLNDTR